VPSSPRRSRTAAVVLAVALALPPAPAPRGAAAAQSLPDLGDVSQASFSPVQERKLGETIIRQLRASGGYINDPEVND
jgi:predicted Zn-dependent protease